MCYFLFANYLFVVSKHDGLDIYNIGLDIYFLRIKFKCTHIFNFRSQRPAYRQQSETLEFGFILFGIP